MRTVPSLSSLGPCRLRFWDPGTASAANPQHLEHIKSRNSDPNASNTHTVRSRIQHRILKHGAKTRIQEQPKQNSQQKLSTAHHKPAPVTHTKPPNKKLIIHLSTNESPAAKKPSYSLLQNPPQKKFSTKEKNAQKRNQIRETQESCEGSSRIRPAAGATAAMVAIRQPWGAWRRGPKTQRNPSEREEGRW